MRNHWTFTYCLYCGAILLRPGRPVCTACDARLSASVPPDTHDDDE